MNEFSCKKELSSSHFNIALKYKVRKIFTLRSNASIMYRWTRYRSVDRIVILRQRFKKKKQYNLHYITYEALPVWFYKAQAAYRFTYKRIKQRMGIMEETSTQNAAKCVTMNTNAEYVFSSLRFDTFETKNRFFTLFPVHSSITYNQHASISPILLIAMNL